MIYSVQNFRILNNDSLRGIQNRESKKNSVPVFRAGFERFEKNGIFNTGGMSVWNVKTQKLISKSLSKEQLKILMQRLEATENERILFCNINHSGKFIKHLEAKFMCTYLLENFTENFKQEFLESKWKFLNRMLKQFEIYKNQLINQGVEL